MAILTTKDAGGTERKLVVSVKQGTTDELIGNSVLVNASGQAIPYFKISHSIAYEVVTAGTGYAIGNVLLRLIGFDELAGTISEYWYNTTTKLVLTTAPTISDLTEKKQSVTGGLTDAQLRASAIPVTEASAAATKTAVEGVNTNLGAKADAEATSDTGSFSAISFTKRILTRLALLVTSSGDILTALNALKAQLPTTLGKKLGSQSLSVVQATHESVSYFSGVAIVPTTLTTGLNYFWIRNPDATKKIKIQSIEVIAMFAGTAAATRSVYALKRFTGATGTTGTVTITPVGAQSSNPTSIADVKWASAGGTLTGATVGATILSLGHPNQLTANIAYDRNINDAPIVLGQNEGVVIQSDGAIITGSTLLFSVRWIEEA